MLNQTAKHALEQLGIQGKDCIGLSFRCKVFPKDNFSGSQKVNLIGRHFSYGLKLFVVTIQFQMISISTSTHIHSNPHPRIRPLA